MDTKAQQKVLLSSDDLIDIITARPAPPDSPPINKHQIRIVKYGDLYKYQNIEGVFGFGLTPIVLLLYVHTSSGGDVVGHWSLLLLRQIGREIEFFDSYGQRPDDMLLNIAKGNRKRLGEDHARLCSMLYDFKRRNPFNKVVSTNKSFQRDAPGVNTCGRYVALRARHWGMTLPQFEDALMDWRERLTREFGRRANYDDVVVYLTQELLNR